MILLFQEIKLFSLKIGMFKVPVPLSTLAGDVSSNCKSKVKVVVSKYYIKVNIFCIIRVRIVSKETVVLRGWKIDKQESGLSTEALII